MEPIVSPKEPIASVATAQEQAAHQNPNSVQIEPAAINPSQSSSTSPAPAQIPRAVPNLIQLVRHTSSQGKTDCAIPAVLELKRGASTQDQKAVCSIYGQLRLVRVVPIQEQSAYVGPTQGQLGSLASNAKLTAQVIEIIPDNCENENVAPEDAAIQPAENRPDNSL